MKTGFSLSAHGLVLQVLDLTDKDFILSISLQDGLHLVEFVGDLLVPVADIKYFVDLLSFLLDDNLLWLHKVDIYLVVYLFEFLHVFLQSPSLYAFMVAIFKNIRWRFHNYLYHFKSTNICTGFSR